MKYGSVSCVDKPVSRIVLGTMRLSENRLEDGFRLLDEVFALGVNAFDTAAVHPNNDAAKRGYLCEANLERLRRAEHLSQERGLTVAQVALAWLFHQPMNLFALVGAGSGAHMAENLAALEIERTEEQCRWLNLETD